MPGLLPEGLAEESSLQFRQSSVVHLEGL